MKTRRNVPGKCCDVTMHGLHKWYAHMFEHMGWMLVAKANGMTDKIDVYKNGLVRLQTAIEQKMKLKKYNDDLLPMMKNVRILASYVNNM